MANHPIVDQLISESKWDITKRNVDNLTFNVNAGNITALQHVEISNYLLANSYNQYCVWRATVIKPEEVAAFQNWMYETFKIDVIYVESITTLPGRGAEGGRTDVIFKMTDLNLGSFAIKRLPLGISWMEDYFDNESDIIPEDIRKKYINIMYKSSVD